MYRIMFRRKILIPYRWIEFNTCLSYAQTPLKVLIRNCNDGTFYYVRNTLSKTCMYVNILTVSFKELKNTQSQYKKKIIKKEHIQEN